MQFDLFVNDILAQK